MWRNRFVCTAADNDDVITLWRGIKLSYAVLPVSRGRGNVTPETGENDVSRLWWRWHWRPMAQSHRRAAALSTHTWRQVTTARGSKDSTVLSLGIFLWFSDSTTTHEPLHLVWWSFARKSTLTTSITVINVKIISQGHIGFVFVVHAWYCLNRFGGIHS